MKDSDGNTDRCVEILRRILDLSISQKCHLEEGRLPEFLSCATERRGLFEEIRNAGLAEVRNESIENLAEKILANDNILISDVSSVMRGMSKKLKHIEMRSQAIKAYTGK